MTPRERLAFGWDVIRAIPQDPELIPMLAKLAMTRVAPVNRHHAEMVAAMQRTCQLTTLEGG